MLHGLNGFKGVTDIMIGIKLLPRSNNEVIKADEDSGMLQQVCALATSTSKHQSANGQFHSFTWLRGRLLSLSNQIL